MVGERRKKFMKAHNLIHYGYGNEIIPKMGQSVLESVVVNVGEDIEVRFLDGTVMKIKF